MIMEFSYTREIEDRLLAPLPLALVASEKVIVSALRALIAAAVMFPFAMWLLGSIPWQARNTPQILVVVLLAALVEAPSGWR